MSHRVRIVRGDVRALDFPDGSFDAIVCLEAAGDICVTERDKDRLVRELHRVLRPGGYVGFSDLALRACPSQQEDDALRAVLYHSGAELVTEWPALFVRHGFTMVDRRDIIADTIETWDRVGAVYEQRSVEAVHRYGHRLARGIRAQIELIPKILAKYATFPVLSALKWLQTELLGDSISQTHELPEQTARVASRFRSFSIVVEEPNGDTAGLGDERRRWCSPG
jgi:SAM-dependent methyltransferase